MTVDALIGIDLGTSSVKTMVLSLDGEVLGQAAREYSHSHPRPGWFEQDPEEWLEASSMTVFEAMSRAQDESDGTVRARGVGVTGQMHSFILLGRNGRPLRPAITWLDTRARDLVPDVERRLRDHKLLHRVGNLPASGLTLPPLLWLQRHEPDLLSNATAILTAKDYLRFRLTQGALNADPSDASAMLLIDLPTRSWSEDVFDVFGLPRMIAPPLAESGTMVGRVSEPSFEMLQGAAVATGCGDQQATTVATNVLQPGDVQLMLGTGAQVAAPVRDARNRSVDTLNHFCHHQYWLSQGSVQNAGSALDWVRSTLNADWGEVVASATLKERCSLPYFLPYLSGERTPIMNSAVGGAWLDINGDTTREQLLSAAVEGVAFGIADAIDAVLENAYGGRDVEIRVSGGGTRGEAYLQLISDAADRPLAVLPDGNATARGAAILGGVAAGIYHDVVEAAEALSLAPKFRVEPNSETVKLLQGRRQRMHTLRDAYVAVHRT